MTSPDLTYPDLTTCLTFPRCLSSLDKIFDLAVGWVGGNQVENHATSLSLQDCKISSRVEITKLDPSVARKSCMSFFLFLDIKRNLITSILSPLQDIEL